MAKYPVNRRPVEMNVTKSSPFFISTDDNRTAIVAIVTITAFLVMTATVAAKVLICRKAGIALHSYDFLLHSAVVLAVAQTVCVVLAVRSGLGKHVSTVPSPQGVDNIQRLQYTASLLAIMLTACCKLSTCLLMRSINDYGCVKTANKILLAAITASSTSGLLASAFRCPLPTPWKAASPAACTGARPIYLYNGIASIITDLQLCGLAVAMVWGVRTNTRSKSLVVALFTCRILCPITLVPSLTSTQFLYQTDDFTWLAVSPTIFAQVSHSLSVITACIPTMKSVLEGLSYTITAAINSNSRDRAPARASHQEHERCNLSLDSSTNSSVTGKKVIAPVRRHPPSPLKLTPDGSRNEAHCSAWATMETQRRGLGEEEQQQQRGSWRSESVVDLRDGIVVMDEVDVRYGGRSEVR